MGDLNQIICNYCKISGVLWWRATLSDVFGQDHGAVREFLIKLSTVNFFRWVFFGRVRAVSSFSCSLDRQQKKIRKKKSLKKKKGSPHLSHTQEQERWKGREMLGATGYESLCNGVSYEKTSVNFLSDLQQSPTQSSHSAGLWSFSLTESCHCVLPSTRCSLTLLLLISNIFPWNLILLPVLGLRV